jgi:hypothetical protein
VGGERGPAEADEAQVAGAALRDGDIDAAEVLVQQRLRRTVTNKQL